MFLAEERFELVEFTGRVVLGGTGHLHIMHTNERAIWLTQPSP
jgi:hypothetical protein